jgi:hypothetical protein
MPCIARAEPRSNTPPPSPDAELASTTTLMQPLTQPLSQGVKEEEDRAIPPPCVALFPLTATPCPTAAKEEVRKSPPPVRATLWYTTRWVALIWPPEAENSPPPMAPARPCAMLTPSRLATESVSKYTPPPLVARPPSRATCATVQRPEQKRWPPWHTGGWSRFPPVVPYCLCPQAKAEADGGVQRRVGGVGVRR